MQKFANAIVTIIYIYNLPWFYKPISDDDINDYVLLSYSIYRLVGNI